VQAAVCGALKGFSMNGNSHPVLREVPIGINASGARRESDSTGRIEVPADRYWGAQTQRSLIHFSIGDDRMPKRTYHAYGYIKKAAALVHCAAGQLLQWKADAIVRGADEAIAGKLDDYFPLYVWQTGSSTQWNMNLNEVLSNRANQLLGGAIGSKKPVHPNDDVNMGQSSNDTFPAAMHVASVIELEQNLVPHAEALAMVIESKSDERKEVIKTGRTHVINVGTPTVGEQWSGWAHQIRYALTRIRVSEEELFELAAVGTGLDAPVSFCRDIASTIAALTGHPFVTAPNKFAAQGSLDAVVAAMICRAHRHGEDTRSCAAGTQRFSRCCEFTLLRTIHLPCRTCERRPKRRSTPRAKVRTVLSKSLRAAQA
jgi:fumarate hydratase, class II